MVLAVSEAGPVRVATSVPRVTVLLDRDPVNTFAVGVAVSLMVWILISMLLRVAGLLPVENRATCLCPHVHVRYPTARSC